MKSIDEIFRDSQTEKRLTLNNKIWDRVDEQLNDKLSKNRLVKMRIVLMSIAAASALFLGSIYIIKAETAYKVEDFQYETHPTLSAEIISHLHELPLINRYSDI